MKNFNLKRFMQVVRYIFGIHRSTYIKSTLIFFLVFVFFFYIFTWKFEAGSEGRASMLYHCANLGVVSLFFALFICSGIAFAPLFNKRHTAISYLTLPASNIEKFVASESVAIVCSVLSCIIGFVAADLLQWVASMIMNKPDVGLASQYLASNWAARFNGMGYYVDDIVRLLWMISFFILGGTFFRKVPPLFTFIVLIAIGLLLGTFLNNIEENAFKGFVKVVLSDGIMTSLLAVLTVVNIVVAYILFCRMPLVSRKWFNV